MGGGKQRVGRGVQRSPGQKRTRTGFVCSGEGKAEGKKSSPSMVKLSTERKRVHFCYCFVLYFFSPQVHCSHGKTKIAAEEILEDRSDKHLSGVVLDKLILPGGMETGQ